MKTSQKSEEIKKNKKKRGGGPQIGYLWLQYGIEKLFFLPVSKARTKKFDILQQCTYIVFVKLSVQYI
jgi:hypothetical protein